MNISSLLEYQRIYNISIDMINDALNALHGDHGPPMDVADPVNIV